MCQTWKLNSSFQVSNSKYRSPSALSFILWLVFSEFRISSSRNGRCDNQSHYELAANTKAIQDNYPYSYSHIYVCGQLLSSPFNLLQLISIFLWQIPSFSYKPFFISFMSLAPCALRGIFVYDESILSQLSHICFCERHRQLRVKTKVKASLNASSTISMACNEKFGN